MFFEVNSIVTIRAVNFATDVSAIAWVDSTAIPSIDVGFWISIVPRPAVCTVASSTGTIRIFFGMLNRSSFSGCTLTAGLILSARM